MEPAPTSPAGPPIWVASWGSRAGLRRVARLGDGWLASGYNTTPAAFRASLAHLYEELVGARATREALRNGIATMWLYVSEARRDAERMLREVLAPMLNRPIEALRELALPIGSVEQSRLRRPPVCRPKRAASGNRSSRTCTPPGSWTASTPRRWNCSPSTAHGSPRHATWSPRTATSRAGRPARYGSILRCGSSARRRSCSSCWPRSFGLTAVARARLGLAQLRGRQLVENSMGRSAARPQARSPSVRRSQS